MTIFINFQPYLIIVGDSSLLDNGAETTSDEETRLSRCNQSQNPM